MYGHKGRRNGQQATYALNKVWTGTFNSPFGVLLVCFVLERGPNLQRKVTIRPRGEGVQRGGFETNTDAGRDEVMDSNPLRETLKDGQLSQAKPSTTSDSRPCWMSKTTKCQTKGVTVTPSARGSAIMAFECFEVHRLIYILQVSGTSATEQNA